MIEVHLIGYTSDLRHLVLDLDADDDRGRYRLVVDADLFLTIDELRDLRRHAGMDPGVPYTPDSARVRGWLDAAASGERDAAAADVPDDAPGNIPDDVPDDGPGDVLGDVPGDVPDEDLSTGPAAHAPRRAGAAREPGAVESGGNAEPEAREPEDVEEPEGVGEAEEAEDAAEPGEEAEDEAPVTSGSEPAGRAGPRRPHGQGETVRVLGSHEVAEALTRQLENLRDAPPPREPPPGDDRGVVRRPPGDRSDSPFESRSESPFESRSESRSEPHAEPLFAAGDERRESERPHPERDERHELVDAAALLDFGDPDDDPDHGPSDDPGRDPGDAPGDDPADGPKPRPVAEIAGPLSPNGSSPPARRQPDVPDSRLSPAEIQGHLRGGRSAAWVAKQAGTDVEWVERWLPPILAERRQVLEEAQRMRVETDDGLAADVLVAAVSQHLEERRIDPAEATWKVKRRSDGRWSVNLRFEEDGRSRSATWALDRDRGRLRPASDLARRLGWTAAPR